MGDWNPILKVKRVAHSSPTGLKDRAQPTLPEENSVLPVVSGLFCSWQAVRLLHVDMSFPSQSPWEASLSLRHAKRKGRICCTEDGYGIQV